MLSDLDRPLLYLSRGDNPPIEQDPFTVRDACSGVQVWGGTGSGKTSGSGRALALAYLRAGFGGLVLAAKPDVEGEWRELMRTAGRAQHLLVVDVSGAHCFNFLGYELSRPGAGGGYTVNMVRLFLTVYEALSRQESSGGGDPFWTRAMIQLLRNALDLAVIAKGERAKDELSVPLLQQIVMSAPTSREEVSSPEWQERSMCFRLINEAGSREMQGQLDEWARYDLHSTVAYFMGEWARMPERTRGSVLSMFTSLTDPFLRRPFRQLFSSTTSFVPELSHQGIVILLNLPVKEYGDAGRAVQVMFKYMWQQALERRDVKANPRPCFLWADESQNFISEYDQQFQTTARSSRGCTVYLTQNINNYFAEMGGKDARARVNALVGNFMTQIWHSNGDPDTNTAAAETIGRSWHTRDTDSGNISESGVSFGGSTSTSYDFDVIPQQFTQLRKGGPENRLEVDAIVYQTGRKWSNGRTYMELTFSQE